MINIEINLTTPKVLHRRIVDRGMEEIVKIKGTREGLVVLINARADFRAVQQRLIEKLSESNGFLEGTAVSIDVGPRDLRTEQLNSLKEILAVHDMVLRRIIAGPRFHRTVVGNARGVKMLVQETAQIRLSSRRKRRRARREPAVPGVPDGGAASGGQITGGMEAAASEAAGTGGQNNQSGDRDEIPVIRHSLTPKEPRADIVSEEQTILIQRTIRSGQLVFHPGNVVVLGDVNPGGEVVAWGNIIVMGAFRGVAHAGAMGNNNAVVAALRLEPSQLRIAGYITRAPEGDFSAMTHPEIARVQDGVVVVEQYQPGSDRY